MTVKLIFDKPILRIILISFFLFFSVMGIKLLVALNKFNRLKYNNGLKLLSQEKTGVSLSNNYLMDNGILLFRLNNRIYFWSDIEGKVKRYPMKVPLSWINNRIKLGGQEFARLLPKYIKYTDFGKMPAKVFLPSQVIYSFDSEEKVNIINIYY